MKFLELLLFVGSTATALASSTTRGRECIPVQNYYWRDYTFKWIPHDAIKAADEVLIGQVLYEDNLIPASLYKHEAITEWVGKRVVTKNVKILCGPDPDRFYWEEVDYRQSEEFLKGYKDGAVEGGYQDGYVTYIGRAFHEGEWKVSKVVPKDIPTSGLQVWDKHGKCAIIPNFEILKYKAGCLF